MHITLRVDCSRAEEGTPEAPNRPSSHRECKNVARGEFYLCYSDIGQGGWRLVVGGWLLTVVARLKVMAEAWVESKQNWRNAELQVVYKTRLNSYKQ
jgi:hypothetical protein